MRLRYGLLALLGLIVAAPVQAYAGNADDDEDPAAEDPENKAPADDDEVPEVAAPKKKKKKKPEAAASETAAPEAAGDETPDRVNFTGELLAGTPLDSGNRALYGVGGGGGLGVEIFISPLLGVHIDGSFLLFSKGKAAGSTSLVAGGIGPRLHFGTALFGADTRHDAWVDAHVNYGSSAGIRRPGFDVAAAVQWEISRNLRLGPIVRYQFGSDPLDKHAQLITAGLTITYGGRVQRTVVHEEPAPVDSDNDGIIDPDDECPKKPAGDHPDTEHNGCPMPDQDDDGVPDVDDECIDEPAGDAPNPKRPGCPAPKAEEKIAKVKGSKIEIFQQVYFETNSATIEERSREVLDVVAKLIKGLNGKRIRIEGHTDDVGTDAYNLDLSKRRARAVAQWLVQNSEVDPALLETEGYGKSRPLVSGSDSDRNRRVEFVILDE